MLCPRCGSETPKWAGRCENCGVALMETRSAIDRRGPYRDGDVAAERYEIRERITTDPLCWSYVAFDQEVEELITLRAIRRTILPRSKDHEAFARRVEPLKAFDFPGVPPFLRLERDEGQSLIISRLVDGFSLRSLIDLRRQENRAFSASETLAVLTAIADILECTAPVTVHGDLRPPHIVIVEDALVVEALGLAAALPTEETIRALKDTPDASGYLAPEVIEGRLGDGRSDVYSLAMIAGELLTGRIPPALGVGLDEFIRHLPPRAADVIERALSPEIDKREERAVDFVNALTSVLGAENWQAAKNSKKDEDITQKRSERSGSLENQKKPRPPSFSRPMFDDMTPRQLPEQPPSAESKLDDADETQKTDAGLVEKALAALDGEESKSADESPKPSIEKDPRIPVTASEEGTQQITADMLEPVDDPDLQTTPRATVGESEDSEPDFDRDPSAPAQAAKEATQQITVDMLEPVDDDDVPLEGGREISRSLGLDPKLVRAARRLDEHRTEDSTTQKKPKNGSEIEGTPPTQEIANEENIQTIVQRAKPTPPPSAPLIPAFVEEDLRTQRTGAPAQMETQATIDPALAEAPPAGLVRGSLGPLQVRVASSPSPRLSPRAVEAAPQEPQEELPAVVVDQSLTEAFGPAEPPSEPTFKVNREDALSSADETTERSRRKARKRSNSTLWLWILIGAFITGTLVLLGIFGVLMLS